MGAWAILGFPSGEAGDVSTLFGLIEAASDNRSRSEKAGLAPCEVADKTAIFRRAVRRIFRDMLRFVQLLYFNL